MGAHTILNIIFKTFLPPERIYRHSQFSKSRWFPQQYCELS